MQFFILLADSINFFVKEDPSWYCGTIHLCSPLVLPCPIHSKYSKWLHNFWQLIYNVIVVAYNDHAFWSLYRSFEVFQQFLAMAKVAQGVGEVIMLDGWNFKQVWQMINVV